MLVGLVRAKDYARLRTRYRDDALDDLVIRGAPRHDSLTEEERATLIADAQAGDALSMRALLSIHARLVEHFARRMWARCSAATGGFGIEDLRQVGRMGLVRAIERFDPSRGVQFSTFASIWIRSKIKRCVDDQIGQIHVPAWARSESNRERRQSLRTTIREAVEAAALPTVDVESLSLAHALTDDDERRSQLRFVRRVIKHLALQGALAPRDVELIMRRYTSPGETLQQVGNSFRLSRERVRQIENALLAVLRGAVRNPALARLSEEPRSIERVGNQRHLRRCLRDSGRIAA